jgi:RNA polymerase sigma-70 factor (ECF subfamily)
MHPDLLEIHDQYYGRVRRFILSLVRDTWVADDLVQETFLKVSLKLDTLHHPSKRSSWIFRIAYNLCQDYFRGQKKGAATDLQGPDIITILGIAPSQEKLEQHQMSSCVQRQMDLLPDAYRTILILSDEQEFDLREMAEILDISIENVKVRLHRARKKFKAILEEKCLFERDERAVLVCLPKTIN